MVESAPSAVDLQEFQFKLHSKLKIFEFTDDSQFKSSANLVTAASRYGLVFIGSPTASLEVVQIKSVESSCTGKVESTNYAKRSIPLPSTPTHLALNCDHSLLAVVVGKDGCATAIIYSVPSFLSQNVAVIREIRVSVTSGVSVLETCWNPAIPTVYTACKSDGSLGVYNIQENSVDINEIPAMARATSFCWSPKGKQIVVGSMNGTLTQYKPDLKAVKAIPAPSLQGTGPFSVVNVFWLTNYQFVSVYNDVGNADARPIMLIVNAPKTGAVTYINYEDICYSYGNLRAPQYYIIHQPNWGVLLVASANSMEVGVLGVVQGGEPAIWQQWNQIDAARAELPLSANHQETFPVGFAFDTGITMQLPWGENQALPSMPMIHILSHHGVLCSFSVINIRQGVATLCVPPEPVPDQSGLGQFKVQQQPTPSSAPAIDINTMTKPDTPAQSVAFGLSAASSPAPAISSTFAKSDSQAGNLFGGSPSLFQTAPNLGTPTVQSPVATTSTGAPTMKLPASSAPMFSAPAKLPAATAATQSFGVLSTTSAGPVNFSLQSSASPINVTSGPPTFGGSTLFGGLTKITTSPAEGTVNKAPQLGPTTTGTPSNFQSMNLSTKPGPQNTPSNLVTAAPVLPKPQAVGVPAFAVKPMGQPLLATPKDMQPLTTVSKQAAKLDILSNTQAVSLNQTPVQVTQPSSNSLTGKKDDVTALNSSTIQYQIRDEVKNFQHDLQELFHRCKNIDLKVGIEEEKSNIVLNLESSMNFYKELQETTDSLMADVHNLKQAVIQSFSWYEDAKSRQKRYNDPTVANFLQIQELDPFSEKQLTYITHLLYDVKLQLKQVDTFLDHQWAEFQDSCKQQTKDKVQMPTLEPMYQSMVRLNAILEKQKYVLKDIASRIKARNKKAASYPSVMNVNLAGSEDDLLIEKELSKLQIDNGDAFAMKYEKVANAERMFTQTKQSKLCEYFTSCSTLNVVPKNPKWLKNALLRTPSKIKAYNTTPNVQRSLGHTFENIAQSQCDSPLRSAEVEANMSSANLFSFALLEPSQSKTQLSEKNTAVQQKPVPSVSLSKTTESQSFKSASNTVPSLPETNFSSFGNMKYAAPVSSSVSTVPVFSFTAATTAVTQSKPQFFTSNTSTPSSVPVNFSLGSNITITSVSSPVDKDKPMQPKPNTIFSFSLPNAATSAKAVEPKKEVSKQALPQPEVVLIKPNVVKTSSNQVTAAEPNSFGGIPTPEVKPSQPFTFVAPQPKTASVAKEPAVGATAATMFKMTSDGIVQGRDSLDNTSAGYSFGSALGLGQQSTPKPKPGSSLIFGSQGAALNIPTPVPSAAVDVTSSSVASPQNLVSKPSFNIAQPAATIAPKSVGIISQTSQSPTTISVAPVTSKAEAVSTAADLTTSFFANVSLSSPTTSTPSLFKQPATVPSAISAASGTSSIFSGSSTPTTPSTSVSIYAQPILSTVSAPLPTSSNPTTSIFAQAISTPATVSSANIFGNTQSSTGDSLLGDKSAIPQTTSSLFASKTTSSTTTCAPSTGTGFSFVQSAAVVSAAEASNTTSIFGGATKITPENAGFAKTVPTPTTEFSFLQPWGATTSQSTTPKTSPSIFSSPGESKPTDTANTDSELSKSSQDSAFGFNTLTVSSADNNKFSFGNLTVSALSPTANITTVASTAATSTFSFAQPPATNATGFGSNLFGKPATTTTTASSFMGQPICSPSTFSQNTGAAFGQSAGNIFAQKPATPSSTGGSIFGQSSGGSLFSGTGASTTVTASASIFGQTVSTPFGGSAPAATTKTGSMFGQTPDFGNTAAATTTSGSIFGQNTFGSPAATSASTGFSFTQATGASGANFGASSGSIFGSKPAFGQPPAFGQAAAFGSSAFGAAPATASGNVFGSPATPTQNTGSFGSSFGSPTAFGQKPVFGTPANFGQSTFGAPPAFGGSPAFGSPPRLFGPGSAAAPGATFGATVQENSTFANLANQSTLGFGSLAQNQTAAPPAQAPQFSGGSQFSSWR